MDLSTRAGRIKLIALDVDGVMTDGGLLFGPNGEALKIFNVNDGLGIKLAQGVGIEFAIITGRVSDIVAARAEELAINLVYQGIANKRALLGELLEKLGFGWPAVAFIGDDLVDLAAMARCGMSVAPANAHPEVKKHAHLVTAASGGKGAVREAIEFILTAQGKMAGIMTELLEAP